VPNMEDNDMEEHNKKLMKVTIITTPLGVGIIIGGIVFGMIQTQIPAILFLLLGTFIIFAGIFVLQPLQERRNSKERNDKPLLWFDNPENIAINAKPSYLSIQRIHNSLLQSLFNAVFDLCVLAFGLGMIGAGTNFLYWQVINPIPGQTGGTLLFFFVLSGMGVFIILKFIERKRVLTIDGTNNKVRFECVRWPRYGTIDYELQTPISYEIIKKKRKITHHEGGDEGTPSRTWTTTHHGVDVAFDLGGEGMIPLLFLEGKKPKTKFKSILELLSSTFEIKDEET
jgi:hypothetical protein